MDSNKWSGYLCLAGGFIYHLVMGCVYLFGAISIYLASYYRQFDDSVTTRFLMMFLPIRGVLSLVLMPVGAYLYTRWSARRLVSIGSAAILGAMLMLSWSKSSASFIFFYAFGFGIATLGYIPAIQCNWKHFPTKTGTVSGIILCGFALGSFVFSFLCRLIVNPNDERPLIHVIHGEITDHYYGPSVYNNVTCLCQLGPYTLQSALRHLGYTSPHLHLVSQASSQQKKRPAASKRTQREHVRRFASLQQFLPSLVGSIAHPVIYRVERRCTVDFQFQYDYMNNECPSVSAGVRSTCFWLIILMLTFSNCTDYCERSSGPVLRVCVQRTRAAVPLQRQLPDECGMCVCACQRGGKNLLGNALCETALRKTLLLPPARTSNVCSFIIDFFCGHFDLNWWGEAFVWSLGGCHGVLSVSYTHLTLPTNREV
eukprot:TRINITY_DN6035_c0_g3_i4.p1 TRINITY_DN6035_c0_g3~~TRINITY_DN6035_c0_g3_i4.p1  ORF type:complete len:450 (+),score=-6.78 TRINITY_DN6035_c0_g3_i4:72-1352(+)